MTLLGPLDRPVPVLWPGARRCPTRRTSDHSPPQTYPAPSDRPVVHPEQLRARAELVARALLGDRRVVMEAMQQLDPVLADDVETWTPAVHTHSRDALFAALLAGDDTLAEVRLTLAGSVVEAGTGCVEWHLQARFDNVGFVNDDILVEPSWEPVECSGVLLLTFDGALVTSVRCYYDTLSLLEQMLPQDGPAPVHPEVDDAP